MEGALRERRSAPEAHPMVLRPGVPICPGADDAIYEKLLWQLVRADRDKRMIVLTHKPVLNDTTVAGRMPWLFSGSIRDGRDDPPA
jgi:hypothetical protein